MESLVVKLDNDIQFFFLIKKQLQICFVSQRYLCHFPQIYNIHLSPNNANIDSCFKYFSNSAIVSEDL